MSASRSISDSLPWLPSGKRCGVCFSIDDVHPGKSTDCYEAGGDLGKGALGHVEWLLERHSKLCVTLFTTPDWREMSPWPTRKLLARVPYLRDRVYLTDVRRRGEMRVDRHPEFVSYLRGLPRTEIALHGLHHIHPGRNVFVEFQNQSVATCRRALEQGLKIFRDAGLEIAPGLGPPGWNAPPALLEAMGQLGLTFVASARDILTPVSAAATTNMSGLKGLSLIYPELTGGGRLVHFASNFQATSPIERALAILDAGGLLAIKGHIIKNAMGLVALDGIDGLYRNYLDLLFGELDRRYGDSLWWTSMGEVAERVMGGASWVASERQAELSA
jgi:Uncharacterized protein conserved in bacteria (DUF2334)